MTLHRMWGLAAFYGARAYNDTNLKSIAIDVWNVAEKYAVSLQDAASGTQHSRNISFATNCIASGGTWLAREAPELST